MKFRRVVFWSHFSAGLLASIPLLIISTTGLLMTFRKPIAAAMHLSKPETKATFKLIKNIHSGEIIGLTGQTVSVMVAICLILLVCSGFILAWKEIRKHV